MNSTQSKALSSFKVTGTDLDLEALQEYIELRMGDELFTIPSKTYFVFRALRQIEPFASKLEYVKQDISEACVTVFEYFKLDNWLEDLATSRITQFFNQLLELEKLPLYTLAKLQTEVISDLKAVQELIKRYESDEYIKRYAQDDQTPRNHTERTKRDFYNRCLSARNEIVEYLTTGIKKRAIQNAQFTGEFLKEILGYHGTDLRDRPYSFRMNPNAHFDFDNIDCVSHRLLDIPISESSEWIELYKDNKLAFYRDLANYTSPAAIFDSFPFYLGTLPFTHDRKAIFKELRVLFESHSWIAFYALALSQVEGIFTEMSTVVSKKVERSLSDKVNQVRPFYNSSLRYFDYYQYHVPNQRNKFMHSGYDDDLEIKSLDMIYDIYHLFNSFHELNNPVVALTKIHKIKNMERFYVISGFTEYFDLLNQLSKDQRSGMQADITFFEKVMLNDSSLSEAICEEVINNTEYFVVLFRESLIDAMNIYSTHFDFEKTNIKGIEELLKTEPELSVLNSSVRGLGGEALTCYWNFFENYRKHLPSLKDTLSHQLAECRSRHEHLLRHITRTNSLINGLEI